MIVAGKKIKFILVIFVVSSVIILVFAFAFNKQRNNAPVVGQETIIIDASIDAGQVRNLNGFLSGVGEGPALDEEMVNALKPQFWSLAYLSHYSFIKNFKTKIAISLSNEFIDDKKKGDYDAKAWDNNWTEWDSFVEERVRYAIDNQIPVKYWNVWGEPDISGGSPPWKGTYAQLLELHARTYRIIHSIDPKAKVVGPGVSTFTPRFRTDDSEVMGIDRFIADLNDIYNVRLDAISWHEIDPYPEQIPQHVELLRNFLKTKFSGYNPELHINEISEPSYFLNPGWAVAILYYSEKAKIDWFSRACWWDVPQKGLAGGLFKPLVNFCWQGLGGLLMPDNKTPQPIYWVHKEYADMAGKRLFSEGIKNTIALGSLDEDKQEIKLIIGRYQHIDWGKTRGESADVAVVIKNYPFQNNTARVIINNIPSHGGRLAGALKKPIQISDEILKTNGESFNIKINDFKEGEAYVVLIRPATSD